MYSGIYHCTGEDTGYGLDGSLCSEDDGVDSETGYDALAQAYGGVMAITGDPSGPPQRAKVYTGDYLTALTGWAATMMGLWEVEKTGRGQVIDLAQFEAVAQTQGNCIPLYTGQGATYGHTGNCAPGFQPYDTFQCQDGWQTGSGYAAKRP
ncbi:MAG TPA: CoA transferase [Candidatus Tectomicrobia bacterium]